MTTSRLQLLGRARRIVVKLGTGLLTDGGGRLEPGRIERLTGQVAALNGDGRQIILVSSGAIAAGMAELSLARRPRRLAELQACAAIGQSKLMALYQEVFARRGIRVAQILLTHDDLGDRARHLNARNTLGELLARRVLPIINENDSVSVDEIKFGDNDRLGALAAALLDADLLIILSHVEGLLSRVTPRGGPGEQAGTEVGPTALVVSTVAGITRDVESLAFGTDRQTSVGGMISKIEAAKIVTRAGAPMIIANGERDGVLTDLLAGREIGTLFLPRTPRLPGRKRWIAFFQRPAGALVVDAGARRALCAGGSSLLAKGVVSVKGRFTSGGLVSIRDEEGSEFARGLAKIGSDAINSTATVVVHRGNLVVL